MKKLLLIMLATVAVLTGCQKESQDFNEKPFVPEEPSEPERPKRIKFEFTRVDISGAEYLTLATDGDRTGARNGRSSSSTILKIDDKGNMTGVIFYANCTEISLDGTPQPGKDSISTDFAICPQSIYDYGEKYILFSRCTIQPMIADSLGNNAFDDAISASYGYYEYNNFLIRKIDGAIFQIGYLDIDKFPRPYSGPFMDLRLYYALQYNAAGDLYMANDGVSKLELVNDRLYLQALTQPGSDSDHIMLDKHSNVYACEADSYDYKLTYTWLDAGSNLYFANGNVMGTKWEGYNDEMSSCVITLIDNEFHAVKTESMPDDDSPLSSKYQISLFKLPTQLPANPSNPNLDTITTIITEKYPFSYGKGIKGIHDSKGQTVIYGYWVYDKATKSLSEREVPDEFVIEDNNSGNNKYSQDGIAYQMQNNNTQIAKYNIIDLTKQVITCDRGAVPPFVVSRSEQTSTEYIEQGIKSSNGAPIRVRTDLKTGRATVFEDPDKRTITELIKIS